MAERLANLEDRAIAVMRKAARDRLPVDAGLCSTLADVVRDAYVAGERRTVETVVAAWREFITNDDLDAFVEVLTELMETAGIQRQDLRESTP
jgi:hypothetical protein